MRTIKLAKTTQASKDEKTVPIVQITYLNKVADAGMVYPYGMHANQPVDTPCILLTIGNDEAHRYIIPLSSKTRQKELKEGEVISGNFFVGSTIFFDEDGNIKVDSINNITVNCGGDQEINITGDDTKTVNGNEERNVTGDYTKTITGNYTKDITGTSDISVTGAATETYTLSKDVVVATNSTLTALLHTITANLKHDGTSIGFYSTTPQTKQTVSGSKNGNSALASLLSALDTIGLITDSSS